MADGQQRSWAEISATFDPMMPKTTYDALRMKYFDDVVAPKVPKDASVSATRAEWTKRTERPSSMSGMTKAKVTAAIMSESAVETMLAPVVKLEAGKGSPIDRLALERSRQSQVKLQRIADREGMNTAIPRGMGALGGAVVDFMAIEAAVGPVVGGAMGEIFTSARLAKVAGQITTNRLSLATYEAINAKQGDEFLAGVKGFGLGAGILIGRGPGAYAAGAAFDLVPGTAAFLKARRLVKSTQEAEELLTKAARGEPVPPRIDQAISEKMHVDAETTRLEGRQSQFTDQKVGQKGARIHLEDVSGRPAIVEIKQHREPQAYQQAMQIVKQGGQFVKFEVHPDDVGLMNRVLAIQQITEDAKYRGQVVKTQPGGADAVVEHAKEQGIPASALSHDTVELHTVKVESPVLTKPSVAETVKAPSRVLTDPEVEQVVKAKFPNATDRDLGFFQQQVRRVQDPNLPAYDKRASIIILGSKAPELLPEEYRTQVTPEVKPVTPEEIAKINEQLQGWAASKVGRPIPLLDVSRTEAGKLQLELDLGPKPNPELLQKLQSEMSAGYVIKQGPTVERINALLKEYGVKPSDVDMQYLLNVGEAEITRALEIAQKGRIGKATRPPIQPSALADKIPLSEQSRYSAAGGGIKVGGKQYDNIQRAIADQGNERFLFEPAGKADVPSQLANAHLDNRLLGSIEDVSGDNLNLATSTLVKKGFRPVVLKGYETGKFEVVYFRQSDATKVVGLIDSLDNFISEQAGRLYNSSDRLVEPVGEIAHRKLGEAFGVPEKYVDQFINDMKRSDFNQGAKIAPEVRNRPYGRRLTLEPEDVSAILPGASAIAMDDVESVEKALGIQLPESAKGATPLVILAKGEGKQIMWHERLHANMMSAEVHGEFPTNIDVAYRRTALDIANGLTKAYDVYGTLPKAGQVEEAFVHAATAVRYSDQTYLGMLANWDGGIDKVMDFVLNTSLNVLAKSYDAIDTVPVRNLRQSLRDLVRRASPDSSYELRKSLQFAVGNGSSHWYDTVEGMWKVRGLNGITQSFKDINGVWDYVLANDGSPMAPSATLRMEQAGLRGPLVPDGAEPSGTEPPTPEVPPEGRWTGALAISALWRPFLPWVASLDVKINKVFELQRARMPIYDRVKDVDDAFRSGELWTQSTWDKAVKVLAPFDNKKQVAVFDYLTYPQKERTTALMNKLGLSQTDALNAEKVHEFLRDYQNSTGVDVLHYLQDIHPRLRAFGWDPQSYFGAMTTPQSASFWDRLIRHEGIWDPKDNHIGRFAGMLIREGVEKKFTGQAIKDLSSLVSKKAPDGRYLIPSAVRWPLTNYVNYMKSIPDQSQIIINDAVGNLMRVTNDRLKAINTKLPDNMKVPYLSGAPKQALNRFMVLSYAMGLGARPAIMIRDAMQAFTGGLTVMGPERFAKAFARFHANWTESFDFAAEKGGLLRKTNPGELYGDIIGEMPVPGKDWMGRLTKWSNQLLAPSRWGHNYARAIMFNGEYHDALSNLQQYRAGRINVGDLLENTSGWFFDKPSQSRLLKMAQDSEVPVEDVATKWSLEAVDLTQWPYRRGTQPTTLRYGMGRILGQYGVWPMNYMDFLYRIGKRSIDYPIKGMRTATTWAAVNYALTHSMEAMGADTSKWFWQSPAGFGGSPHLDFVQALMVAPENTDEGRAARKTVLEYPMNFVPAMAEMRAIMRAVQDGGLNEFPPSGPNLLRILGFKPLVQVEKDRDWEQWTSHQLGFDQYRRH